MTFSGILLEAHQVHRLQHAVVANFEVGSAEPGHDPVAVGHEYVHPYRLALRRERRLLRRR
jgi:hypothetical protein